MAVTVLIPTTLRAYTDRKSEIDLDGGTVGEVLQKLVALYPDSKKSLFDEDGKPRSFVNVFLGETNIKNLSGLDTATKDGDTIMLIPAIAGGSPVDESVIPDERTTELSNDEIKRYSRHLLLPEVGVDGQEKLKAAKVLIVGLGAWGLPLPSTLPPLAWERWACLTLTWLKSPICSGRLSTARAMWVAQKSPARATPSNASIPT